MVIVYTVKMQSYRHMKLKKNNPEIALFSLDLPGMELTFFTAADITLSSAFPSKAVMISAVTEQRWHSLGSFS